MNTRSLTKTVIVALAVPFSAIGAVWFLYLLGYNMSIGVWVGLIALLGVDAETGVFMLLYLDLSYEEAKKEGRLRTLADLHEAIVHGAVKRIRPKFMTVATDFIGFFPIMWATGTGSDVMKRIARADDRRHLHVVPARAARLSRDLRDLEVAFRDEGGERAEHRGVKRSPSRPERGGCPRAGTGRASATPRSIAHPLSPIPNPHGVHVGTVNSGT